MGSRVEKAGGTGKVERVETGVGMYSGKRLFLKNKRINNSIDRYRRRCRYTCLMTPGQLHFKICFQWGWAEASAEEGRRLCYFIRLRLHHGGIKNILTLLYKSKALFYLAPKSCAFPGDLYV